MHLSQQEVSLRVELGGVAVVLLTSLIAFGNLVFHSRHKTLEPFREPQNWMISLKACTDTTLLILLALMFTIHRPYRVPVQYLIRTSILCILAAEILLVRDLRRGFRQSISERVREVIYSLTLLMCITLSILPLSFRRHVPRAPFWAALLPNTATIAFCNYLQFRMLQDVRINARSLEVGIKLRSSAMCLASVFANLVLLLISILPGLHPWTQYFYLTVVLLFNSTLYTMKRLIQVRRVAHRQDGRRPSTMSSAKSLRGPGRDEIPDLPPAIKLEGNLPQSQAKCGSIEELDTTLGLEARLETTSG